MLIFVTTSVPWTMFSQKVRIPLPVYACLRICTAAQVDNPFSVSHAV